MHIFCWASNLLCPLFQTLPYLPCPLPSSGGKGFGISLKSACHCRPPIWNGIDEIFRYRRGRF